MKTSTVLLLAGLMVVSLLLNTESVLAQWGGVDNSMPHYGRDNACSDHLVNPTPLGSPPSLLPETMFLCPRSSGATTWSATIIRTNFPPTTVCSMSSRPVSTHSFQCNFTTVGSYKGTITYCVGSSCGQSAPADFQWTIP